MNDRAPAGRAVPVSTTDPQVLALLDALDCELALGGYSADQRFSYSVEQLARAGVRLVGVAVGRRLVGVGGLELQRERVGELKRVFVAPAFRGTGIADAVMTALVDLARDHDIDVLRLETGYRQRAAIAFFHRHGFAEIPRFGPYVNSEAAVCLQRRLAPAGAP